MEKQIHTFAAKRIKSRAHMVLFGDTPYRGKKVESKLRYCRKDKHTKNWKDYD